MATRSVNNLFRRLKTAGFERAFVRPAILPDWWDESLESDAGVLSDVELRVARFLGLSITDVRNPDFALAIPKARSTVLRKAQNMDVERLAPAIHAARRVAEAVVRNLRGKSPVPIPKDPDVWRNALRREGDPVTLDVMLKDLWDRGVPVIRLERLPTPAFQGMATVIDGRPVIVIGQKHDAPSRVGFFVAHEAGHIANGDCADGTTIVDEEESVTETDGIERRADQFASRVLLGKSKVSELSAKTFDKLAEQAYAIELDSGTEAGALLFHWAREHQDFQRASQAVAALYRQLGARQQLTEHLTRNVDVENASESDRALLGLAVGDAEPAATAD